MTRYTPPPPESKPVAAYGAKLQSAVDAAALALLECIYADHPAGITTAEAAGVDASHFTDDLQILWLAADVGRELSRPRLFRLAARALARCHFWDARAPLCSYGSLRWSETTLEHLFGAMFPTDAGTRHAAAKLLSLTKLQRDFTANLRTLDCMLAEVA